MHYFSNFSLHFNSITLLGIILLLGLIGGEIAKRIRYLPQITGYILVGFIFGSGGLNLIDQTILGKANLFVDISLSIILFELGRFLDFKWLKHDPGILYMSLAESMLTFLLILGVLYYFAGMYALPSLLAATVAIATSPAIILMVASDLSAEGPVTRRILILTSLNNLYALILFIILSPISQTDASYHLLFFIPYCLIGSVALGLMMFFIINYLARWVGKHKENQFILLAGGILCALGLAHAFNLSSMLTLFSIGIAARNLNKDHSLMEINFGWLGRILFVLLFVITGIHLKLQGLIQATWLVLAFIFIRMGAKLIGIWLFSKSSQVTQRQGVAISFALLPMAGVAIGMSNILIDFNPDLGNTLMLTVTASVAILNLIGPITTQLAFMMAGESLVEKELVRSTR